MRLLALDRPTINVLVPPRIIDAHVHIGKWPEFDLVFTLEDLETVMAQYGYSGAVVMPALVGSPREANNKLAKIIQNDSRFYFFAWVGPTTVPSELDSYLPTVRGLKFHPSISQTGLYEGRMHSALEWADQYSMPFLYHAGRTPISWPDKLMPIAPSYPNVKFIVAHLGGNAYDRIYDTLRRWPALPENVYVDSSTARHPDILRRAIETWGSDRVLFGTDLPFTDQRLNFDCLRYAGLDDDEQFLSTNLYSLLKR